MFERLVDEVDIACLLADEIEIEIEVWERRWRWRCGSVLGLDAVMAGRGMVAAGRRMETRCEIGGSVEGMGYWVWGAIGGVGGCCELF